MTWVQGRVSQWEDGETCLNTVTANRTLAMVEGEGLPRFGPWTVLSKRSYTPNMKSIPSPCLQTFANILYSTGPPSIQGSIKPRHPQVEPNWMKSSLRLKHHAESIPYLLHWFWHCSEANCSKQNSVQSQAVWKGHCKSKTLDRRPCTGRGQEAVVIFLFGLEALFTRDSRVLSYAVSSSPKL